MKRCAECGHKKYVHNSNLYGIECESCAANSDDCNGYVEGDEEE